MTAYEENHEDVAAYLSKGMVLCPLSPEICV